MKMTEFKERIMPNLRKKSRSKLTKVFEHFNKAENKDKLKVLLEKSQELAKTSPEQHPEPQLVS